MSYVIVGSGVFGLSTALELCRRKESVIVIDRFSFCDFSSNSSDLNRIVRSDYRGDPIYTDYAKKSIETFKRWNNECENLNKDPIYNECGMLALSEKDDINSNSSQSYIQEQFKLLQTSLLSCNDISSQYPMFNGMNKNQFQQGYYSKFAGYCHSENTLRFIKYKCEKLNGNRIRFFYNTNIVTINTVNVHPKGKGKGKGLGKGQKSSKILKQCRSLVLENNETKHRFKLKNIRKVIFCTGIWTKQILKEFNLALFDNFETVPNIVSYFKFKNENNSILGSSIMANYYKTRNFPVYLMDIESTGLYGFPPMYDESSKLFLIKIANHGKLAPNYDMDTRLPDIKTKDIFLKMIKNYLPIWNDLELLKCKVCFYNCTKDHHFLIDNIPSYENIAVATGGSGHAFKFAPVLGEMVVNCLNKDSSLEEINRFSWTRPRYPCDFFLKPINDNLNDGPKTTNHLVSKL